MTAAVEDKKKKAVDKAFGDMGLYHLERSHLSLESLQELANACERIGYDKAKEAIIEVGNAKEFEDEDFYNGLDAAVEAIDTIALEETMKA